MFPFCASWKYKKTFGSEAAVQRCSKKQVLLNISQDSQENTWGL